MSKGKNNADNAPRAGIPVREKRFRPGVTHQIVPRTMKEYLEIVTVSHEIRITWWCFGVMAMCTAAFLVTWFLWGTGGMPHMTEGAVKWFGGGTLGIVGSAFTAIIASKFRKRK
jgi:hypothetical protein